MATATVSSQARLTSEAVLPQHPAATAWYDGRLSLQAAAVSEAVVRVMVALVLVRVKVQVQMGMLVRVVLVLVPQIGAPHLAPWST